LRRVVCLGLRRGGVCVLLHVLSPPHCAPRARHDGPLHTARWLLGYASVRAADFDASSDDDGDSVTERLRQPASLSARRLGSKALAFVLRQASAARAGVGVSFAKADKDKELYKVRRAWCSLVCMRTRTCGALFPLPPWLLC
jgi:hypothetical protein